MAIEDALILATLLKEQWDHADGHQEAFYLYQREREEHTATVHAESYKQMKLGQLRHRALVRLRNVALRLLPAAVLERKLIATNRFKSEPWILRFRAAAPATLLGGPGSTEESGSGGPAVPIFSGDEEEGISVRRSRRRRKATGTSLR